jgi:uncharacterized pyridoxal phosphate-containing UPF0001 family protein
MRQIAVNLIQVRDRIELAALAAKREPEEIQLMAVSRPNLFWRKLCSRGY